VGAICLTGVIVGGVKVARYFAGSPGTVRTVRVVPAGPMIRGTVRDDAGNRVAGAELLLCTQGKGINIYQPSVPAGGGGGGGGADAPATTAADGSFAIPKPPVHFELVVRAPAGYAQVSAETLADSTDVRLAPWGRVDGRVLAGTRPLANAQIYTFETPAPYGFTTVMRQTQTTTDAAGRFSFPRLAPGEVRLAQHDPQTRTFHRWSYVVVEPGRTASVTIGGVGRPVVGRFANPPAATRPVLWDYRSPTYSPTAMLRQTDAPPVSPPEHRSGETLEQWRAIEEAFGRTAEGSRYKLLELGGWKLRVDPDGAFRVDDVPAGEYALDASILKRSGANRTEEFAKAHATVIVDPMPTGRSDQPQDLGVIQLESVAPSAGETVRAITR
jgi:hypothetical protein